MSKEVNLNLNSASLRHGLVGALRLFNKYRAFLFFLIAASMYGFIIWRINALSNPAPAQISETTNQVSSPHIDQALVEKIEKLQDNSINVQSLFRQARQNPFQE